MRASGYAQTRQAVTPLLTTCARGDSNSHVREDIRV
jgi:hypothetical protein